MMVESTNVSLRGAGNLGGSGALEQPTHLKTALEIVRQAELLIGCSIQS